MDAKCFKCGRGFPAKNEDDIAGDGDCEDCKLKAKDVALRVDLEMERRNKANPNRFLSKRQRIIKEIMSQPDGAFRVNARDLIDL